MLPSKSSSGYAVSIYASPNAGEPDGWYPEAYGYIRGIARLPERVGPEKQRIWQLTVVRRLRRQGVVFLTDAAAHSYEKSWGRAWSICWSMPILRTIVGHL